MKAYTDISQSKKLAEFLPIESADMYYISGDKYDVNFGSGVYEEIADWLDDGTPRPADIPCWSLAALLNILPYPSLLKTFSGWRCDSYNKEGNTCMLGESADNQIDACYEMILKLHELNLL